MKSQIFYALTLSTFSLVSAHIAPRQAAGSLLTSSVPSEILTAGPESVTGTALLPSGTAISELTGAIATVTATSAMPTPTTDIEPCQNAGGKYAPFCEPTNGTSVRPDETVYVTWDPSYFPSDASVMIEVSYADASAKSGNSVFTTDQVQNSLGWAAVNIKSSWLQGKSSNNITFHIARVVADENSDSSATILNGPTVEIRSDEDSSTNAPLGTSSSSKDYGHLGTVVGLTIGFSFLALVLVSGLFILFRRQKQKHRTYGIAQSRSQRLDQPRHRGWHGKSSMENHRQGVVMA